jgi:hypothetical protein
MPCERPVIGRWWSLAAALLAAGSVCRPAQAARIFSNGVAQATLVGDKSEMKPGSGTGDVSLVVSLGPNYAEALSIASPGMWGVTATVRGGGVDDVRHSGSGSASMAMTVTDMVRPTVDGGNGTDEIRFVQHLTITGLTRASLAGPGGFHAMVGAGVRQRFPHETTATIVYSAGEVLTSEDGYTQRMPSEATWTLRAAESFEFTLEFVVDALAYAQDPEARAFAQSDWGSTFTLGEVTDVFNVTTNTPIPADQFHLYGEDGFDWAHPRAVPEPGTALLLPAAFMATLRRRTTR